MNKELVDGLVDGIVEIEKQNMHKKFELQSGKGVQYARAKADADTVNGILNLVDEMVQK